MEIKQFLEQTVTTLASYSEQEQVNVFNEIKFALLAHRKEKRERISKEIEELQSLDKLIYAGDSTIRGGDAALKCSPVIESEIRRGY